MIIKCRNKIDAEQLFSSTTYQTELFDKCVYCHSDVENDFYEYNGEYVGQPYRCDCDKAKEELRAKEELFNAIRHLESFIDENRVNKTTKEYLISEINRTYEEEAPSVLDYLLRDN